MYPYMHIRTYYFDTVEVRGYLNTVHIVVTWRREKVIHSTTITRVCTYLDVLSTSMYVSTYVEQVILITIITRVCTYLDVMRTSMHVGT